MLFGIAFLLCQHLKIEKSDIPHCLNAVRDCFSALSRILLHDGSETLGRKARSMKPEEMLLAMEIKMHSFFPRQLFLQLHPGEAEAFICIRNLKSNIALKIGIVGI